MNTQDIMIGARLTHIRELKTALEKSRREAAELRDENAALKSHLDIATAAAMELKNGASVEMWDGWNLILGSDKVAKDLPGLVALAKERGGNVWIVLDGPKENVLHDGNVRISYTGGVGEHRADRFIVAFVRAARYLGLADGIRVRTHDKDLAREVVRLGATKCESLHSS